MDTYISESEIRILLGKNAYLLIGHKKFYPVNFTVLRPFAHCVVQATVRPHA